MRSARASRRHARPPARRRSLRARGRCCRRPSPRSRALPPRSCPSSISAAATSLRTERPEAQTRAPRLHGRQQRVGPRADEDEHRCRRRLFERLQQRILRCGDERVRLVDDHDAAASFERPVRRAVDDVAHRLDLDRTGVARLDEDARRDGHRARCACRRRTRRTHRIQIASEESRGCAARRGIEAVKRLGSRDRDEAFADAGRPREDQTGRNGVALDANATAARQASDDR